MAGRVPSRRAAVLREMGLGPLWRLRTQGAQRLDEEAGEGGGERGAEAPPGAALAGVVAAHAVPRPLVADVPSPPAAAVSSPARTARPLPEPRSAGRSSAETAAGDIAAHADPVRSARIATLGWDELEEDIRQCRACVLCERRRQAVPGVGDRQARWMLIGEGPGAEEDQRGEPFVGQAGRLLDNMLAAIGLRRGEDVYIGNAVKCRPPHNRTPERDELAACRPYLERQIALVQPRLLVALGRPAAQALLDREIAISAARGKLFDHGGVPVVVTYHPAYLLRNPRDKAKAWEDLCFARRFMARAPANG